MQKGTYVGSYSGVNVLDRNCVVRQDFPKIKRLEEAFFYKYYQEGPEITRDKRVNGRECFRVAQRSYQRLLHLQRRECMSCS